jgi:hypothetical protein
MFRFLFNHRGETGLVGTFEQWLYYRGIPCGLYHRFYWREIRREQKVGRFRRLFGGVA